MWIRSLQARNYKSFSDSGMVELAQRFTFFIGRNNSGKTALLEALNRNQYVPKPHRDATMPKWQVNNPVSRFDILAVASANELLRALLERNQAIRVPFKPGFPEGRMVQDLLQSGGAIFHLYYTDQGIKAAKYPSHGLFEQPDAQPSMSVTVKPEPAAQSYSIGATKSNGEDTAGELAAHVVGRKLFFFGAERLRVAKCGLGAPASLAVDASNLARVLFQMQENPNLWERFNTNVNRVLNNVRRVVTTGVGGSEIEIRIWPVDPLSERDDLVVKLDDSGTGVAQVLAILCAAMTNDSATIAIDEPGNFLHPGAAKALVQVLKEFDHQYVFTTHSLDLIAEAEPEKVYLVRWDDGVSSVTPVDVGDIPTQRQMAAELGVSLTDVLAIERVLWVEGDTETACVPVVVREIKGSFPSNLAVVRVRSVGDLVGTKKLKGLWDAHVRLTSAGGMVPARSTFLFDRERRSDSDIAELEKLSAGVMRFLPRLCFENYFLDAELLAAELRSNGERLGQATPDASGVISWMLANGEAFVPSSVWTGELSDSWKSKVDAARLLDKMFLDLLKTEYRKTQHSLSLTRRLIEKGGTDWVELRSIVSERLDF